MNSTDSLRRQIDALHGRLEKLYAHLEQPTSLTSQVIDSVWKELGIAAEELQVANEELTQQNDQIATMLQDAAVQHRYYQNLVNHIPEAYLTTTQDGKVQEANLMAARLLNLPQSQLIGKLLVTFVPPEQRMFFRKELNRVSQECRPCNWAIWFQPRDLMPIHLTLTTSIAAHPDGEEQISIHWILREANDAWSKSTFPLQEQPSQKDEPDPTIDSLLDNRLILSYPRGETISLTRQNLWLVREGLVKLHTLTEDNEEVLLGLLGPMTPFSAGSAFLPVYQATAVTDVQLLQFSAAEVKASPPLARLLLPRLGDRLQQMESLLSIAGQRHVRQRLYLLLKLLKQEVGEPFADGVRLKLRLTHEEIASACCTSRVTITRLLGELQRQQKVAIDSRFHIILTSAF
ncbi:PAS domain-containing protein [Leptolyngbya ohadii]|uniref:PAS domain-containing protein n=1 Tax=Leptolyngbya ohadii TaxID=1962290 RepID=UPI000B5994BE|nr:PAS domain-containing protein [Leptolyngbya ohadii]